MNFLDNRASTVRASSGKISNEKEGVGWGRGRGLGSKTSQGELLRLLPRVRWVAKVTVGSSLAVNRFLQVELLHDDTGTKVPVLPDDLDELQVSFLTRAICIDEDRQGLGDTNGVGELDKRTASEASGNEGLGWRRLSECSNLLLKRDAPIHRAV